MNPAQIHYFRELLLGWRLELQEEMDRTVDLLKREAASFPDTLDRATQEGEFALELRARDRERKLIRKIDDSLRLLDEGAYGFCETCGEDVGFRRLEARPVSTQCIDCKVLAEKRERQYG